MKNTNKFRNKFRILFSLLLTIAVFFNMSVSAFALTRDVQMLEGESAEFEHYASYSWITGYSWNVKNGSDVIKITNGANTRKCAIEAIGAGEATLVGTAKGNRNTSYSHEVRVSVEANKNGSLNEINGKSPDQLADNTAYILVDGVASTFYLDHSGDTDGGDKSFSLYSWENGEKNHSIYLLIDKDAAVKEAVDTSSKLTKYKSMTIYYKDSDTDSSSSTYYSGILSSEGNNVMMLTAKGAGPHYEGCFSGDVKQLHSTKQHKIEGIFKVTYGEASSPDAYAATSQSNAGSGNKTSDISVQASVKTVNLTMGSKESQKIVISAKGKDLPKSYKFSFANSADFMTCQWTGEWTGDSHPLTISSSKAGNGIVTVSLLDANTDKVLASTKITVQIASSSASSGHTHIDDPFCPTCDGLGDCPECYGEGYKDCDRCFMGKCPRCGGTGEILSYSYGELRSRDCTSCHGSGKCSRCDGDDEIKCGKCGGDRVCPTCDGTGFKPGRSLDN